MFESREFAVVTIAGGKAHKVYTDVLTEDMVRQVPAGWTFANGKNVRKYKTVVIPAGTRVYTSALCGTARTNGTVTWENDFAVAEEVTCSKCVKKCVKKFEN